MDAQHDLAAHPWPEGAEVKVRMGLHTGEPKVGGERYVGIGVHRAARIGAAGHGGQVLLSSTTKELVEEDLPAGVTIRDLGERRLKDLEQPQHLYQLVIEGLQGDFAQLRTLDVELRRRRRRMYAGAAVIGVLAAAVAIPVFAFGQGGSGGGVQVAANSLAQIDPGSNRVVGAVQNIGARPASVSYGSGSLWVANLDDNTVSRVDPRTRSVVGRIPVAATQAGLAAGGGGVWIANGVLGSISRIEPRFATLGSAIAVTRSSPDQQALAVAVANHAVWVVNGGGTVTKVDPARKKVVETVDVGSYPNAIALGDGQVWVVNSGAESGSVTRIDATLASVDIPVGHDPSAIAVGEGAAWVANGGDGTVSRIDLQTSQATDTIPVGKKPIALAVGAGSIWVANLGDGTVSRIDPSTRRVTKTIRVGGSPAGLAFAAGSLWVAVQAGAAVAERTGGTVHVVVNYFDSTDPALAYTTESWQLEYATCAKLLNYPDRPAPAGSQLVPEVARSLPRISDGGKTYTFTIRKGFHFSPPSNEPVTAQTFKYTIERSLSPKLHGLGAVYQSYLGKPSFLSDVVGESAYLRGTKAHIAGVTAEGDTLTIRLTRPDGDLPARLSMPFFCAVPLGTPVTAKGVSTIPSAGPYYIASYTPKQQIVLKRNPHYHGARPRRPEQIVYSVGVSETRGLALVKVGQADYVVDLTSGQIRGLVARYGRGSLAARAGRQRLFANPLLGVSFLTLNANRPLFADLRMRRAVNFAIDRSAMAALQLGEPFDHYLPPGTPGYRAAHIYPLDHPDVAAARRLTGGRGARAVLYNCAYSPCVDQAQIVKRNLRAIGIDVEVKQFHGNTLQSKLNTPGEPFDIANNGWFNDYNDPANILNTFFDNTPFFSDPAYNRALDAAAKLTGPRRYRGYGQLDLDLARNAAPFAAYATVNSYAFFSARVGCQLYVPDYQWDLAALCIRKRARG